MQLFNSLKRLIQRNRGGEKTTIENSTQSTEALQKLLQMLDRTREDEYSCDEVYHLLDQYAEAVERGEDAAQLMPLVEYHLNMCRDCHEEYEALLIILESSPTL